MSLQRIKTKNMHRRNWPVAILTIREVYDKQETAAFIKAWEEATRIGSPLKTIVLNNEVIKFEGFLRKRPRICSVPKAARKLAIKHFAVAQDVLKSKAEENKDCVEINIKLQQPKYPETENILRDVINDALGVYVSYDPKQVTIK